MHAEATFGLRFAHERIARQRGAAREARLAEEARRRHRRSLRRAVGHQIIGIGERLAAEPALRPARTR